MFYVLVIPFSSVESWVFSSLIMHKFHTHGPAGLVQGLLSSFWWALIDLIIELLCFIISPLIINQTES
jgi:hypothetical protein